LAWIGIVRDRFPHAIVGVAAVRPLATSRVAVVRIIEAVVRADAAFSKRFAIKIAMEPVIAILVAVDEAMDNPPPNYRDLPNEPAAHPSLQAQRVSCD
jgi:hypothetical protein